MCVIVLLATVFYVLVGLLAGYMLGYFMFLLSCSNFLFKIYFFKKKKKKKKKKRSFRNVIRMSKGLDPVLCPISLQMLCADDKGKE